MCPVILWLLLGSVFKARLGHLAEAFWRKILFSKFTLGMSRKIKKKRCSHRECRARAKAKVKKFWRQALSIALVVCCRRRPSNKPPTRMLRSLHLQNLCIGNGRRERLVWTPSSQDLGLPPLTFFFGWSRLSTPAPITGYFLQSGLSGEEDQVGVGSSGSTLWY